MIDRRSMPVPPDVSVLTQILSMQYYELQPCDIPHLNDDPDETIGNLK